MAWPISPSPNTAIGASRGTLDQPLHHQRLHAAGAALRQDAPRAVEQVADAAPRDVQAAAYRAGFVSALERAQHLAADGVFTLRHGVEPGGHTQQATDGGSAVAHARPHVIRVLRGADQRGAEQFGGPRRPRGSEQPFDARAAFDAHDAGDLFGVEQLLRGPARLRNRRPTSAARTADGASR